MGKLSVLEKLFIKNPAAGVKNASSLFNLPYSLSSGGKTIVGLGALGITGVSTKKQITNVNKMGKITAGKMSDMTDSVKLSPGITDVVSGKKQLNNSLRNYGATGDIVFALHNMR